MACTLTVELEMWSSRNNAAFFRRANATPPEGRGALGFASLPYRFIQITITPHAESYCIGAPEGPG